MKQLFDFGAFPLNPRVRMPMIMEILSCSPVEGFERSFTCCLWISLFSDSTTTPLLRKFSWNHPPLPPHNISCPQKVFLKTTLSSSPPLPHPPSHLSSVIFWKLPSPSPSYDISCPVKCSGRFADKWIACMISWLAEQLSDRFRIYWIYHSTRVCRTQINWHRHWKEDQYGYGIHCYGWRSIRCAAVHTCIEPLDSLLERSISCIDPSTFSALLHPFKYPIIWIVQQHLENR